MPDLSWLEAPAWILALAVSLWLVVRSVAWGMQIVEGPKARYMSNGQSAEFRGESREILKGLRSALREQDQIDRETLEVLKQVRDELKGHNQAALSRHALVKEIHQIVSDWKD